MVLKFKKCSVFQVVVHDVPMRRGVMMLEPHHLVVLGGQVFRRLGIEGLQGSVEALFMDKS